MIAIGGFIAINTFINKSSSKLKGTFIYNESIKYIFDGKGNGSMHDGNDEYEYTYTVDKDKLTIDFKNEAVRDATYTFKNENDTLKLIGGEGTIGGEYVLKKESK